MEKTEQIQNTEKAKSCSINQNLCKIILDYIPTQNKFLIILNFKLNEKLLNSINSIFLESNPISKLNYRKFTKSIYNVQMRKKVKSVSKKQTQIIR